MPGSSPGGEATGGSHGGNGADTSGSIGPELPPPADEADIPYPQGDGDVSEWCALQSQTDLGNVARLRARHGHDLLYVRHQGWHVWDGRRWDRTSGDDQAQLKAQQTAAKIRDEARLIRCRDAERATALEKHAQRSGAGGAVTSMVTHARPYLTVGAEAMDIRPDLLACANGTLELGRGEIRRRGPRREDRITRLAPVAYEPAAEAPLFRAFISEILPDREVREFVQRWLGYCVTGYAHEQVLVIFYGQGANGKSTLLDVIRHVLGDYALVLSFASLLADDRRRGGDATPDLARLAGARLVTASEPELGRAFSEAVIKTLTGEGRILARHLHREFFEFEPQFKLVLSCNNKPTVRGNDEGTWRRVLLVPFTQTIPPERRDKRLVAKLIAEAPGVLAWLIEGARWYLADGLTVPEAVRMATAEYRDESDPMGDFLRSWVVQVPEAQVPAAKLHLAYEAWCADQMVQPVSKRRFGRKMGDRGFSKLKNSSVIYTGIALTAEAEAAALRAEQAASGAGRKAR